MPASARCCSRRKSGGSRPRSSATGASPSPTGVPARVSPSVPRRWCSRGSTSVKYRGLDPDRPEHELVLLTIATEPGKERLIHIDLVFEGDAHIQLRTDAIDCRLEDFGPAEPSKVTPCDHLGEDWIRVAPA